MLTTFDEYDFIFAIVILSKGREHLINDMTLSILDPKLKKRTFLYINEKELDNYEEKCPDIKIVTHKKNNGYGGVLNSLIYLMKNKTKIKYAIILDDDKQIFKSMVGNRGRKIPKELRYNIFANAVQVMIDLKLPYYIFSTSSSIIKYQQNTPYRVGFALPQGAYIIDPHNIDCRFVEGMHNYEDFDFMVEVMLKHKIILSEQRMAILSRRKSEDIIGGCNSFRTSENEKKSRKWLLDKWGSSVTFTQNIYGNDRPTLIKR